MLAPVLVGFGLGFLLAAQIGPVTLLIVRSVLRGGRAVAVGLAMACAVAAIDLVYAALGVAGVGRVLATGSTRLLFGLASAAILLMVGLRTAWTGLSARAGLESREDVVLPRRAFATAIAATALNPLTIALWTVSFPAAVPDSAATSAPRVAVLLLGTSLGTLTWYCGLATAIALARRRAGPTLIRVVDVASGCGVIGFGAVLGYRSLHER